jgi:hypothetical protein
MIGKSYRENRDFIRMDLDSEIAFKVPGTGRLCKGRAKDLSHTGMKFETTEELRPGTVLEVTIRLGNEKFRPMEAMFTVLRIEALPEKGFVVSGRLQDIK